MGIALSLEKYLSSHPVRFDMVQHTHTGSSLQSALASHVEASRVAKAVVLEDDRRFLMAVLPASKKVKLGFLRDEIGRPMRLASEETLRRVFSDCETGAVPPVGAAYGMETIWDDSLLNVPDVYFEAGDHETLVHMKSTDFVAMLDGSQHMSFGTAH